MLENLGEIFNSLKKMTFTFYHELTFKSNIFVLFYESCTSTNFEFVKIERIANFHKKLPFHAISFHNSTNEYDITNYFYIVRR